MQGFNAHWNVNREQRGSLIIPVTKFMVKNIVIITQGAYPKGMAPTQRMHLYGKALVEAGCHVTILLPNPPRSIFNNSDHRGIYEGVHFEYTCTTLHRPGSFLKRRLVFMFGQLNLLKYLVVNHRKIDAVIITAIPYFGSLIIYSLLLKLLGILAIREINEFSFFRKKATNFPKKLYQNVNRSLSPKLFKGFMVISEKLEDFYKPKISTHQDLLLVPILVDINEYNQQTRPDKKNSIVCCGSLSELKDGTLSLIKAFSLIKDNFNDYNLVLTGGHPDSLDYKLAKQLVSDLNISDKVQFTGFLPRKELIREQLEASVLVLAKPESTHADYCFPTKLGEYLSTKNPVVVTDTGEISKHLTDNKNAFLVKPNSVEELAKKLSWVLTHKKEAMEVSKSGYEKVKNTFDYKLYGKIIQRFLSELKNY